MVNDLLGQAVKAVLALHYSFTVLTILYVNLQKSTRVYANALSHPYFYDAGTAFCTGFVSVVCLVAFLYTPCISAFRSLLTSDGTGRAVESTLFAICIDALQRELVDII